MSPEQDFACQHCKQRHPGPPTGFALPAPDYWSPRLTDDPLNVLEPEICVIRGQGFFVRGLIEIPVIDHDEPFVWTVWVSLSKDNFLRAVEQWDRPGRENEPPYFGWLSNQIPTYPTSTLNLKTNLHTRPLGERPRIELEPTNHPLAVEQRNGITVARVREIAETLLHPA
jgi:hypothetical protein